MILAELTWYIGGGSWLHGSEPFIRDAVADSLRIASSASGFSVQVGLCCLNRGSSHALLTDVPAIDAFITPPAACSWQLAAEVVNQRIEAMRSAVNVYIPFSFIVVFGPYVTGVRYAKPADMLAAPGFMAVGFGLSEHAMAAYFKPYSLYKRMSVRRSDLPDVLQCMLSRFCVVLRMLSASLPQAVDQQFLKRIHDCMTFTPDEYAAYALLGAKHARKALSMPALRYAWDLGYTLPLLPLVRSVFYQNRSHPYDAVKRAV